MTPASGVDWSGLAAWLRSLAAPATLVELAVIAGCLGLSALVVRLASGPQARPGIWFGRRIVDGVLFPALALGAVLVARWALHGTAGQGAYGTDLDALMPRLRAAVAQVPRVLSDPMPGVLLASFAADGLELAVMFWIKDPENGEGNVRSDVNLAILRTLNEAGVEIPSPQRVVRQLAE